MSVRTVADEELVQARDNLQLAIRHLSQIVIDRVDGYDEYKDYYKMVMADVLAELIKQRERLSP